MTAIALDSIGTKYLPTAQIRAHLLTLKNPSVSWLHIAKTIGLSDNTLALVRDSKSKYTTRRVADKILQSDPLDFMPPEADVEVVRRILAGREFSIPWGEKGLYARELYEEYGWTPSRIARALAMGGAQIKEVLGYE